MEEWSPPSQPSLPAEAQTAPVEALLKLAPSEPMVVEVSEVVKPQECFFPLKSSKHGGFLSHGGTPKSPWLSVLSHGHDLDDE